MKPVFEMKAIDKSFGVVQALKNTDLEIFPNEIVGLVGENGAGKSTLMKILLGIHTRDGGEILIDGKPVTITNPHDAHNNGIFMVFQEQSILNNMTVYENMFLGFEHLFQVNGMINKKKMVETAREELSRYDTDIDPTAQVNTLTFVQRQMVEVLRNLWKAGISGMENVLVVLDEPTSALGEKDIRLLFHQMNELKNHASIVFISHKLNEIVEMCDRTYVLKDGKNAGIFKKDDVSEDKLRKNMIGGSIEGEYYLVDQQRTPGEKVILDVQNLTKKGIFEGLSFQVHEGEIFCVTGTVGSGKEKLCEVLYGLDLSDEGSIFLNGNEIKPRTPIEAVANGIGISPDDRKGKGLVMGMTVGDNITISIMKRVISIRKLTAIARQIIERLRILTPSEKTLIRNLSGGNQQKAIIGRLLLSNYKLVILAFPTRGVDVGAKREIYALIREMAEKNTSILLMGDSYEEDIGLANTIMTMKDGKCTAILDATIKKPSLEELANYIL